MEDTEEEDTKEEETKQQQQQRRRRRRQRQRQRQEEEEEEEEEEIMDELTSALVCRWPYGVSSTCSIFFLFINNVVLLSNTFKYFQILSNTFKYISH